jgi:hypothetical protein
MELRLERKPQLNETPVIPTGERVVVLTPPIDENYWLYRVRLSDRQAIVGFPKFSTVGVGFAQEEDWNTNLPYMCTAEEIFKHILHNKGDASIDDADVMLAIRMVQQAAVADRARMVPRSGGQGGSSDRRD